MSRHTKIVGIDEAGRGPLAGPVAVGIAVVPYDFDWAELPGVTDSKKLSPKKRAGIFEQVKTLKSLGSLDYAVAMVGAPTIDKKGIVPAIQLATKRALDRLVLDPGRVMVKLDGGLRAPEEYRQETIIKGDQKEQVIGLASICAKETRDTYMLRLATKSNYEVYEFSSHMGYGTRKHQEAILTHGLTDQHRKQFCQNLLSR